MGRTFFNSWELWQKMTFVLGVCIFLVFCVAYGKLVWMNRFVRRQEVIDEEKRTRIQALRESGQLVETPKVHDIPFGVRAIQSGIQVDGIWISKTSTPVPSEVRDLSRMSSDNITSSDAGKEPKVVVVQTSTSPQSVRPSSSPRRTSMQRSQNSSSFVEHIDEKSKINSNRNSYQPRKSSHLRYNSYGAYDEATLEKLEGNTSPKKKPYSRRPHGSGSKHMYSEAESSAADNERNSGTSSDSDATFSERKTMAEPSSVKYSSFPMVSKAEYFTVPMESPTHELSDPFASPPEASLSSRRPSAQAGESSWYLGSDDEHRESVTTQTLFIPGELHVNKAIRKVNSGFEVLPAGTFGDFKGKGVDRSQSVLEEEDSQAKLKKKGRYTGTIEHGSSSSRPS